MMTMSCWTEPSKMETPLQWDFVVVVARVDDDWWRWLLYPCYGSIVWMPTQSRRSNHHPHLQRYDCFCDEPLGDGGVGATGRDFSARWHRNCCYCYGARAFVERKSKECEELPPPRWHRRSVSEKIVWLVGFG